MTLIQWNEKEFRDDCFVHTYDHQGAASKPFHFIALPSVSHASRSTCTELAQTLIDWAHISTKFNFHAHLHTIYDLQTT